MRFLHYPETAWLYVDLCERTDVDALKVAPGVVLDSDGDGQLVGIDIDRASQVVNLSYLETSALPITDLSLAGKNA